MASNRIYIQVDVNNDDAQKQIDVINQKIAAIGPNSEKSTAQASQGVKSFSVAIDQAQSHVDSLAQAITGMGIGQAIRQMITLGDQMNRTMAAMSDMAGGVEGMQKLRAAADGLGLDWANVEQSANQLRNAGLKMSEIVPVIQAIGASSVKAGGDIRENFTSAIEGIAKTWGRDYITVKGLVENLGKVGVLVVPILEKALHESANQVREDMRNFSPQALVKMITDGADAAAGAAKKIADNSPVAEFNRSKNAAEDFANTLTEVLGPAIIQLLKALRPLIDLLTDALKLFNSLPEPVKNTTVMLLAFGAALKTVTTIAALFGAGGVLGSIVSGIARLGSALGALFGEASVLTTLGETIALAVGWIPAVLVGLAAIASAYALIFINKKKADAPPASDKMPDEGPLQRPDLDKILKEREEAANALSQAQKRYDSAALQGIAAVAAEYEILYRSVTKVKDAEALATAQKALELNVATEVLKHSQDLHKENIKAAEEDAAVARKIAVARASVMPDDSFAGRQDIAQFTAEEEQKQIQEQSAIRINEQKKVTVDQISNIQTLYQAHKISLDAATKDRRDAETAFTDFYIAQTQLAIDKGTEAGLKAEREKNALILEEHKQLMDEMLQDSLARIQQEASLTTAYATATEAHTVDERLKQIKTVESAQIASVEKTRDAQIAAAQEALQFYIAKHPGGAGVTEETQKEMREEARLRDAANTQIQLDRINSWKEGNDAIIEQQKQVYTQMQDLFGSLFDAFTQKSKSVWAAVGDVIKNALLGAIKAVVTSQLAAQLTGILGFGSVAFKQNGLSLVPVFSGAGAPPQPAAVSSDLKVLSDAIGSSDTGSGGSTGSANRTVDDVIADARDVSGSSGGFTPANYTPVTAGSYGGYAAGTVGGAGHIPGVTGGVSSAMTPAMQINKLKDSLNIGKPVTISNTGLGGAITQIPWASATPMQKLGSILKSPAAGSLEAMFGTSLFMGGLQKKGPVGHAETVGGGALTGLGIATMFPKLGLSGPMGAVGGAGAGLLAVGLQHGGALGLGLDVGGGAMMGAAIGSIIPGLGTLAGAAIGAGVGAIAGAVRMLIPTQLQKAHSQILQSYGINITQNSILQQVVDIANQKYGGDIRLAVQSTDVQDMVRLYALSTGQNQANLPRPMYSATFAQSQAGGLQLQPVYSGGQLVANPYTGTTTTQVQNALAQSVFIQLNPGHAQALFAGQVVNVMNQNPGAVAAANTTAVQSGQGRTAQAAALLEPATVLR